VSRRDTYEVSRRDTYGGSYPLYKQTEGNRQRADARIPPRKSIQSETLARYYEQQRKAGR
jgi:hypothetical protein